MSLLFDIGAFHSHPFRWRINTKQTEYKTDIARLTEEMSKREARLLITVISVVALGTVLLGIGIVVLGFIQAGVDAP